MDPAALYIIILVDGEQRPFIKGPFDSVARCEESVTIVRRTQDINRIVRYACQTERKAPKWFDPLWDKYIYIAK